MKIDMRKFRTLYARQPTTTECYLHFPNTDGKQPRILINVRSFDFFKSVGVSHIKPLISTDNNTIALVESPDNTGINVKSRSYLQNRYLIDLVKNIVGKHSGVKFLGIVDPDEKNIVYDLTKPIFY